MSLESQAAQLDKISAEATKLAEHARIAAIHFRNREVPRAAAHTLAAEGHLIAISVALDVVAAEHAAVSRTVI